MTDGNRFGPIYWKENHDQAIDSPYTYCHGGTKQDSGKTQASDQRETIADLEGIAMTQLDDSRIINIDMDRLDYITQNEPIGLF